ncbi:MAG: SRPBCC family protein, partial [Candidatus Kapaibacterium sp.]
MENEISIKCSILIAAPREAVWDFTQDYSKRSSWDTAVLKTEVLQTDPNMVVKLQTKGRTTMTFIYKLFDKPNKTSLVAREIESPIIE